MTTTTVFPFGFFRPYMEVPTHSTSVLPGTGGRRTRRAEFGDLPTDYLLFLRGSLKFPRNGTTWQTWLDFVKARRGAAGSFLYKCVGDATLSRVTDEAVGTGDAIETDFPLDFRHVDTGTLVVELDGVPTAAYTLTGNNTEAGPVIEFAAAPGAGVAITATYEWYHPVTFARDPDSFRVRIIHQGTTPATTIAVVEDAELLGDQPGGHFV